MQGTVVLPCNCKHEFQDKTYGKGNRLHNVAKSNDKAYCTVCSPRQMKIKEDHLAKDGKFFGQTVDVRKDISRREKKI